MGMTGVTFGIFGFIFGLIALHNVGELEKRVKALEASGHVEAESKTSQHDT